MAVGIACIKAVPVDSDSKLAGARTVQEEWARADIIRSNRICPRPLNNRVRKDCNSRGIEATRTHKSAIYKKVHGVSDGLTRQRGWIHRSCQSHRTTILSRNRFHLRCRWRIDRDVEAATRLITPGIRGRRCYFCRANEEGGT